MPTVALYRCPKCRTEYRPLDAGTRRFICCGVSLQRGNVSSWKNSPRVEQEVRPSVVSPRPSAASVHLPKGTELIEVIPPRETIVDAPTVGMLLSSFSTGSLYSLEITGDHKSRRFLVRGTPEGVAHIRRQLQATYDQVSFRTLSAEEDPAQPSNLPTVCAQLTLARPAYLPVRTFEEGDFLEDDPVRGILGALDGMEAGERALSQIILLPAPPQWSRRYEGSARQVEKSMMGEAMSLGLVVRQFVSVIAVMTAVAFGLWALLSFIQKSWLTFFLAGALFAGAVGGVIFLYTLISEQTNVNPKLVQTKIITPAYDASIRLFVIGKTRERAERKLREIVAAYRRLNLQSGNAFARKGGFALGQIAEFNPRVLSLDRPSVWNELTAHVTRLSVNELAGMWHLPVGQATPLLNRTLTRRILPLPTTVSDGVSVGYSRHQGQNVPVHLPLRTLAHHAFMVAKTQKGKSTLMAHLAATAMEQDASLIVIDPHGDLARSLLSRVPRHRVGDVIYIDFSDTQQFVGLNLLDVKQGRNADAIVSNIVRVGELIWSDNWGPRMEDALRMALRTLLSVYEAMVRERRNQFTLLDITSLFELPSFRRRLLKDYVKDTEILQWWAGYFDTMLYDNLRMDVMNPLLTKINRFSTHSVVRNIVGQSGSTVNFRELVDRRRILLVNTATGVIGPDAGRLLGAVLVDYINFSVREQMAIPDPAQRARVVIVVDEFQSIPGVDYPGLLAELQKMGASFILATQALGQLNAIDKKLRPAIMSNVETLFVFQTSADDADILRHELDDEVTATDIVNLSDHSCYIKTQSGIDRLPVMHVETLAPQNGDPLVAEQIVAQMMRYTRPSKIVEAEREAIKQQWFGREPSLLKQKMETQNQTSSQGQSQAGKSAGAAQTDRVQTRSQSGDVSAKHPQAPSGNLQIPIEDDRGHLGDGEARSKAKKPIQPQPANPDIATMRVHSQPKEPLGTPTCQAKAAHLSEQSAVASVPSDKPVDANEPTDERAGLDAEGKENGTERVIEQDTVQVNVTLVATTPSLSAEDDSAKPKSDAKRINP